MNHAFNPAAKGVVLHHHVGHGGGGVNFEAIDLLGERAVGVELGGADGQQTLLRRQAVVLYADHCIAGGGQAFAPLDQGDRGGRFFSRCRNAQAGSVFGRGFAG